MRPGLQISYSKKMKPVGEEAPTDLKEIFENHLPRSTELLTIVALEY